MSKVRMTVTIEPEQHAALRRLRSRTGMDVSTLTRYALDQFLRQPAIFLPLNATDSSNETSRE